MNNITKEDMIKLSNKLAKIKEQLFDLKLASKNLRDNKADKFIIQSEIAKKVNELTQNFDWINNKLQNVPNINFNDYKQNKIVDTAKADYEQKISNLKNECEQLNKKCQDLEQTLAIINETPDTTDMFSSDQYIAWADGISNKYELTWKDIKSLTLIEDFKKLYLYKFVEWNPEGFYQIRFMSNDYDDQAKQGYFGFLTISSDNKVNYYVEKEGKKITPTDFVVETENENEKDFSLKALEIINWLIDAKVLKLNKKEK